MFKYLRPNGSLGLIATNTIAEGDTRSTGLRWICLNGGSIYSAIKRYKWPGVASVVVSIIHLIKGNYKGSKKLDQKNIEKISAFLFPDGVHEDPKKLIQNSGKSFVGSIILGMGFTFDDSGDSDETSTSIPIPISVLKDLKNDNTKNSQVIYPYIEHELNSSPTHSYHRYVVDLEI